MGGCGEDGGREQEGETEAARALHHSDTNSALSQFRSGVDAAKPHLARSLRSQVIDTDACSQTGNCQQPYESLNACAINSASWAGRHGFGNNGP
jgi:hypothetical protein